MEVLSEYSGHIMIPVTDIYRINYDTATGTPLSFGFIWVCLVAFGHSC